MQRASLLYFVLSLGSILALAGCSTFSRDWKAARSAPAPVDDIQGRWQGTWLSQTLGHDGRLRCLVASPGGNQYEARFHATFWKLFTYGYTVPLTVTATNGVFQFQGQAKLGWLAGGLYHYEGQATSTNFFSTYHSKGDHGTFQMRRPLPSD